jgi:hypothetical protein
MAVPVAPLIRLTALLGGAYVAAKAVETVMGYKEPTYVIFDGDEDRWAYGYLIGWKKNDKVDFDFRDAHDLTPMTSRAQDERYVKSQLRERMNQTKQVIVLVGESTKNLRKYVPWEIDLAIESGLPIIVVNLNGKRKMDEERCPTSLRTHCAIHVEHKMKIIKHALDNWPSQYRGLSGEGRAKSGWFYGNEVYQSLGL